jgi:NADH dehydrogenase/NADH:ubiquinone oxidoreductase subunit G
MSAVTITINGQKVSARAGWTILRAAQAAGIDIPTLCHHPALAPIGACRVCLVEVTGQRSLQPACTFPVADRMEIQTESPKVVGARKFVLELLFSERNHFCMACEMSGGCELQNLGYRYGLDHWMYPTYTQKFQVDASAPYHLLDHNRCVLCRRCVRACAELAANHTLDLRQRGAHTLLCADMDVPLGESGCTSCGTCVNVCPTGALIDKRSAFMAAPDKTERVATVCTQCSLGCGVSVVLHRGHVLRLESLWDGTVSGGLLCRRGRFEALADGRRRVLEPLMKEKGRAVPVGWEKALAEAARRLARTDAASLGVFATTRLTNEALGLLNQIFVQRLNAGQRGMGNCLVPAVPGAASAKLADVPDSDLVLVVGADPAREQPVASFFIKRAVDRGARLVMVEREASELSAFADARFALKEIGAALDQARAAVKPVVVYGAAADKETIDALSELQAKAAFLPLQPGVNTLTAAALDLNAAMDPSVCRILFVAAGDENGTLDALATQADPQAFVIALSCCESPLTARADLVLPMASWLERSGTFTNTEGTLLRAHAAVPPSGQSRPDWDILGRVAEKLGVTAAGVKKH